MLGPTMLRVVGLNKCTLNTDLCTVHTYANFDTIEYDFVDLENLNNIFIIFVVNLT